MSEIVEWKPAEWRRSWTAAQDPLVLFVHTPLCGTCKAARRMLEIALELIPSLHAAAANLNVMPELAQIFRIESVPCLLLKRSDGGVAKQYRLGSVPEIVAWLRAAGATGRSIPL